MKSTVRYTIRSHGYDWVTHRADVKKLVNYLAERGVAGTHQSSEAYYRSDDYTDKGWVGERSFAITYKSPADRARVELIMSGCPRVCPMTAMEQPTCNVQ